MQMLHYWNLPNCGLGSIPGEDPGYWKSGLGTSWTGCNVWPLERVYPEGNDQRRMVQQTCSIHRSGGEVIHRPYESQHTDEWAAWNQRAGAKVLLGAHRQIDRFRNLI